MSDGRSKRVVLVVLSMVALVGLTGCAQTVDDVKRDAAFAKVCHEHGGKVYYADPYGDIACDFTDRTKP